MIGFPPPQSTVAASANWTIYHTTALNMTLNSAFACRW